MFVEGLRALTYSEIRTWKQCRHKHDLQYTQKLTAVADGPSYFRTGHFVHRFIELLYSHLQKEKLTLEELYIQMEAEWEIETKDSLEPKDELDVDLAIIRGMIGAYHKHLFLTEEFEGYLPELEVSAMIGEAKAWAKMDGVVKMDGKYFIHEIKTASGFSENDRKVCNIDDQMNHYLMIAKAKYPQRNFVGAIRTIIKKPGIKQTKKETVAEYCQRVVQDYEERPEFYIVRLTLLKSEEAIAEYRQSFEAIYKELVVNTGVQFKSPSQSCGMCDFIDLCTEPNVELADAIRKDQFYVRGQMHPELAILNAPTVQNTNQKGVIV